MGITNTQTIQISSGIHIYLGVFEFGVFFRLRFHKGKSIVRHSSSDFMWCSLKMAYYNILVLTAHACSTLKLYEY